VKVSIRAEDIAAVDFSDVATTERIGPVVPGEVLREEFMVPLGLSGRALARELGVPSNRISEIVAGERVITAETAILLARRFGTSAEFWLNLQTAHDLEMAHLRLRPRVSGSQGHKRFAEIAKYLKNKKPVGQVTIRELLRWFDAKYRGVHVNETIHAALFDNDLHIEPDLNAQHLDSVIEFREGVVIDEIEEQFRKNYRPLHEGSVLNEIEAAMLDKLYVERLCDCLVGWIDRNPRVTEREVQAQAAALNELEYDELENEDGADIISLPEPPYRTGKLPADNLATQISPNTNISEEALRSLRHRFERSKTAR
jgi:addiction module HigA family antidote